MTSFESLAAALRAAVPSWVQRYNRKYQTDAVLRMNEVLRGSGLSRKEVCERTGWKPAYLSRILSGGENLTLRTVARFEEAVGADVLTVTSAPPTLRPAAQTAPARPLQTPPVHVTRPTRLVPLSWMRGTGFTVVTGREGLAVGRFASPAAGN